MIPCQFNILQQCDKPFACGMNGCELAARRLRTDEHSRHCKHGVVSGECNVCKVFFENCVHTMHPASIVISSHKSQGTGWKEAAEMVDHPAHYGAADDPYEVIKVLAAWKLDFRLGSTVKYIARFDKKGNPIEDLKKARWYLDHYISELEMEKKE